MMLGCGYHKKLLSIGSGEVGDASGETIKKRLIVYLSIDDKRLILSTEYCLVLFLFSFFSCC